MSQGLQAEIKQRVPFRSAGTELMLSILRTAALLEHGLSEVLKPFGLTGTQHNVLRILRGAGAKGLCGREIGERMISRVPDVPRMLDRMEAMRLITRERDQEDRRHVTARISPAGLALLERVDPLLEAYENARLGGLTGARLKSLIDGLAQVREQL